jgi:23S rRNA (cytidine1920-2'-O)/16S rRNA (cytidine1409-2'-O)-methyltransferase
VAENQKKRFVKPGRERLDKLLVDKGLAETHSRARALVLAGDVLVNGERRDKPGELFDSAVRLELKAVFPWVSRGALKLLEAFEAFPISVEDLVCADIGASTGGFTEVLLAKGARRVYAVDVGYGQLAWSLASDARVTVMDRVNGRNLDAGCFDSPIRFITADASFISLKLLLPAIERCLAPGGHAVVLIKPQFEAGRGRLGKGGVVRGEELHRAILEEIVAFAAAETGFFVRGLTGSPITGPKGNVEFLCHLDLAGPSLIPDLSELVSSAHLRAARRKGDKGV